MGHLECIANKLEPGDIIFNRRILSVAAIIFNGFWRHTGIFLGTPHMLSKKFDQDESVLAHYGVSFTKYLSHHHPKAYNYFEVVSCKSSAFIESNKPGVAISSFEKFFDVVYTAAIRSNLPNLEIALAIEEAFEQYGKGFNFSLSFENENRLTCTQLIYLAYRSNHNNNKQGIKFTIFRHHGIPTMSTNDIVGHFVKDIHGKKQSFTFVFFGKYRRKDKVFEFGSQGDFVDSYYLFQERYTPSTSKRAALLSWVNVLVKQALIKPYLLLIFLRSRRSRGKYIPTDKTLHYSKKASYKDFFGF